MWPGQTCGVSASVHNCRSATTLQVRVLKTDQCHGEADRCLGQDEYGGLSSALVQQLMVSKGAYLGGLSVFKRLLICRMGQLRQVVPGRFGDILRRCSWDRGNWYGDLLGGYTGARKEGNKGVQEERPS